MIIKKTKIRSLESIKTFLRKYDEVIIATTINENNKPLLEKIGFTSSLQTGETVLPSKVGPVSIFNAEGRYIKQKDKPMETVYRVTEWKWNEWHGPYRVEKTDFRNVPYKRYPRIFITPPSIELTISNNQNEKLLLSPKIKVADEITLMHTINLFLEIFGLCQFLDPNMQKIESELRRLNWTILPQGKMPWSSLKKAVEKIIEETPKGNRSYLEHRLEYINKHGPDFTAVGEAGFHGYIIMGFTDKNLYILESPFYGNATYILENEWEELSKKTKAEIINNDLCKYRLIHKEGWDSELEKVF